MTTLQKVILLCLSLALVADAFAPSPIVSRVAQDSLCASPSCLQVAPVDMFEATSTTVAAATLDPTTFLSDLLSVFISSNAILAVPIIAALAVASLVGWAIIAYANPAEPEDD